MLKPVGKNIYQLAVFIKKVLFYNSIIKSKEDGSDDTNKYKPNPWNSNIPTDC